MTAFLTARWVNLVLVTYAVPEELLQRRLPPGCQLDRLEDHAVVSLVAFDFKQTRVLGIGWPGYRDFPEINLRFYVRCGADRGVCFVREFVPSRLVAGLARGIYNEPYLATQMVSTTERSGESLSVRHELTLDGQASTIAVTGHFAPYRPPPASTEHFLKEHRWGFGHTRSGKLLRYEVIHPEWDIYPVRSLELNWNWSEVYGPQWAALAEQKPLSVIFAAGSEVAVYPRRVPKLIEDRPQTS